MLRVNGGPTGAGTRVVKEPARDWTHICDVHDSPAGGAPPVWLEASYTRCPDCGAKRPESMKDYGLPSFKEFVDLRRDK